MLNAIVLKTIFNSAVLKTIFIIFNNIIKENIIKDVKI